MHDLQRISLLSRPTPMEPAPRLAVEIGLRAEDLWIKRDDVTGLGGGGNRLRKLEYTVGAALRDGADKLVTVGAPQSNHARLTVAVAAKLGMMAVLVFPGAPGDSSSGNLVLDGLLGAQVVWAGDLQPHELTGVAEEVMTDLRGRGQHPVLIPFGGSSPLAARGYVECAEEMLDQIPDIRHVIVAVGSGATMAGLVTRLGTERVLGVDVGAHPDARATVASFASSIAASPIAPKKWGLPAHCLRSRARTHGCDLRAVRPESKARVKIPDACMAIGVPCIDPFTMMRKKQVKLKL